MIYIVYLLLVAVQHWYAKKRGWLGTERNQKRYWMLCCAELILIAAIRGVTIGADTVTYVDALHYYSALPKNELWFAKLVYPFDFEVGYFGLTKLCAFINMPQPLFLGLIAAITYVPTFWFIRRYSKIPYISLLAYFALGLFSYSLGLFRQMIAMSIVLCGIPFVEKKKPLHFAAFVAAACFFHTTAVVTAVLFVLYLFPPKKYWKWIVPAELVTLILGRPICLLLIKIFPKYKNFLGGIYDQQGGTYLMLILLNVLLFALIYLYERGFVKSHLTITALTLATLVQSVGYSMAIVGRAITYFSIFAVLAFAEIAFVLLNHSEVFPIIRDDAVAAYTWCVAFCEKHKLTVVKLIWIAFIGGLLLLALRDIIGNQYITPYTLWFMK